MPYCPMCECEYVRGIVACADCGVPLVVSLPAQPDHSGEKTIVVYRNAGDAYLTGMVQGLLEHNHILCVVHRESLSDYYPGVFSMGHSVLVLEKDARKARELIRAFFPDGNGLTGAPARKGTQGGGALK